MATTYEEWNQKIKDQVNSDSDYQAAKAKLDQTIANKPVYAGTYDNDVANAYNNIINREKFQYNLDDDALYKQYADKYMAAGKLAMKNTMGQAAALTGGYGSSYGQAVGQQTYDSYLQGLNDKALEFYDRAYGRYQDEGDRLKDAYGLAKDMADTEYGRYTDLLGQWNTDRGYDTDAMNTAWNRGYQIGNDAYSYVQNEYEQALEKAEILAQYGIFSGYAELFGQDVANQMKAAYDAANATGGGGGGGGGRSTKKKTTTKDTGLSNLEKNYSGSTGSTSSSSTKSSKSSDKIIVAGGAAKATTLYKMTK